MRKTENETCRKTDRIRWKDAKRQMDNDSMREKEVNRNSEEGVKREIQKDKRERE